MLEWLYGTISYMFMEHVGDIIDGKGRICIYELNEEFEPIHCIVCDANWLMDCEKNWAAIEDKPFTFIYSTNPLVIVEINPETGEINVIKETPYIISQV